MAAHEHVYTGTMSSRRLACVCQAWVPGPRATNADEGDGSHKPDPKRIGSRCRVDCSCGWRGPDVSMFGQGFEPWAAHYRQAFGLDPVLP